MVEHGQNHEIKYGKDHSLKLAEEALELNYTDKATNANYRLIITRKEELQQQQQEKLDILRALPAEVAALFLPPLLEIFSETTRQLALIDHGRKVEETLDCFSNGKLRLYTGTDNYVIESDQSFGANENQRVGVLPNYMIANALTNQNARVERTRESVAIRIIVPKRK